MTDTAVTASPTFLDALREQLDEAGTYNRNAEIPPVAVLWPDPAREWEPLVPRLNALVPVLSLGEYDPGELIGPAAWIRCAVARVLEGVVPEGELPVIYLPGWTVGRLRGVAYYQRPFQPLAELQYRGSLWLQPDGQEWSVSAFLQRKDRGLGVAVQQGEQARVAMLEALIDLVDQPVSILRDNAPLKATDFYAMGPQFGSSVGTEIIDAIAGGETDWVEFKETARYNMVPVHGTGGKGQPVELQPGADPNLEREIWKAVGGFLNSFHGGTLLLGVRDDKSLRGLDDDYSVTKAGRKGQDPRDAFVLFVMGLLERRFGKKVVSCVSATIHEVDGKDIGCVKVRPAPWPAWADEGKPGEGNEVFYLRSSNSTHRLPPSQAAEYIRTRWPS